LRTIRGKLIVGVVPGLVLLISALCAGVYIYMYRVLTEQQDVSLNNRAHVVSGRVRWPEDNPVHILSPDVDYGEFGRSSRPSCFEIFGFDGSPLLRSQLLGQTDLPLPVLNDDGPVYSDVTFPTGRPGRAVCLRYTPVATTQLSLPPDLRKALAAGKKYTIVLAKDAGPVIDPTRVLLWSLVAMVATMATGIIVLMSLALRRGLQPLEQIARQAATRSPDDAPDLFPIDGMPGELQPICDRLNDLLRRHYDALQRQRRFTTDAAHELRTPIAEIRSVAEVASKWADLQSAREALGDVAQVTHRMEAIVTTLLAMARCDYSKQATTFQPVELNPLIEKVWQTFAPHAQQRQVGMQMQLAANTPVQSDPAMLESILVNLLSNAADYAVAGSMISCTTRLTDRELELQISNLVESLSQEDLSHFFEPFWRKDASASDDRHCGLGLALTRAYALTLNAPITVELNDAGQVSFQLKLTRTLPSAVGTAEPSSALAGLLAATAC
jgi:two-component system sensor histidine kinase QseC